MTNFNVNCTLPVSVVTFVGSPNVRGTLGIIWSCLSIILICTWSVLHLNVPVQATPRNKKERYVRAAARLWTKIFWMSVNVLAPEWSLGKAWSDYRAVSAAEADLNRLRLEDKVPWTRKHTYFTNMGGFTIKFDEVTPCAEDDPAVATADGQGAAQNNLAGEKPPMDSTSYASKDSTSPEYKQVVTAAQENSRPSSAASQDGQGVRAAINGTIDADEEVIEPYIVKKLADLENAPLKRPGRWRESVLPIGQIHTGTNRRNFGLAVDAVNNSYFTWWYNVKALEGDRWILDVNQIIIARRVGILRTLPNVSEDELDDRNQGDLLVKVIALGQILWFMVQLMVRLARRLPTSQLEIMTFAFAVSTTFTYCLLLEKPKNVQCSIEIPASRYANAAEVARIALAAPDPVWFRDSRWISNFSISRSAKTGRNLLASGTFSTFIFGAVHCIAWKFVFPTTVEQILWQISAVVTATWPLIMVCLLLCADASLPTDDTCRPSRFEDALFGTLVLVCLCGSLIFLAARLFILVEIFRSLAFLEPEAYLTSWADGFPHLS
ncbi:hypothetical protein K461DRAFT_226034 [Myriangium duriaei CBS 260.36]|uniref:Uncharacterized protein n=1 Tax=Myriangium duriaei CBS 260.36 TaxID=1168546 RepID=A0A9P4J578_9PEZI|nr:hypothetical protein K461DRAFT_226034 [Myriangium duriaei CBS 260.36]